jgi:hypothetical protein
MYDAPRGFLASFTWPIKRPGRTLGSFFLTALATMLGGSVWADGPQPEQLPSQILERVGKSGAPILLDKLCGVYCLTYLLHLQGRTGSFEEVREYVDVGDSGSSLASLQQAAAHFGQDLTVVTCPPNRLQQLPLPAIAHIEASNASPVAHYVVLLAVHDKSVVLFDWNVRSVDFYDRQDFSTRCSGFYLTQYQRSRGQLLVIALSILNALIAAIVFTRGFSVTRLRSWLGHMTWRRSISVPKDATTLSLQ